MSIVVCNECDRYVDSDFDMDCFVGYYDPKRYGLKPNSDKVLCEWCRDEYPELDEDEESFVQVGDHTPERKSA